jgi:predicted AAA+ superfamily ATPase
MPFKTCKRCNIQNRTISGQDCRSIRKEKKAYFYDWTRAANEAGIFKNYVAVELKSLIDAWEDNGFGLLKLFYVRDRDGRETDFLIVKDNNPWLLVEAKLSRTSIDFHHKKTRQLFNGIPFVQIVKEEMITEKRSDGIYQMSASRFFA